MVDYHFPLNYFRSFFNFLLDSRPSSKIDDDSRLKLTSVTKRVKEESNKVALEHKELHAYVSKVGKSIDRVYNVFLI